MTCGNLQYVYVYIILYSVLGTPIKIHSCANYTNYAAFDCSLNMQNMIRQTFDGAQISIFELKKKWDGGVGWCGVVVTATILKRNDVRINKLPGATIAVR